MALVGGWLIGRERLGALRARRLGMAGKARPGTARQGGAWHGWGNSAVVIVAGIAPEKQSGDVHVRRILHRGGDEQALDLIPLIVDQDLFLLVEGFE